MILQKGETKMINGLVFTLGASGSVLINCYEMGRYIGFSSLQQMFDLLKIKNIKDIDVSQLMYLEQIELALESKMRDGDTWFEYNLFEDKIKVQFSQTDDVTKEHIKITVNEKDEYSYDSFHTQYKAIRHEPEFVFLHDILRYILISKDTFSRGIA